MGSGSTEVADGWHASPHTVTEPWIVLPPRCQQHGLKERLGRGIDQAAAVQRLPGAGSQACTSAAIAHAGSLAAAKSARLATCEQRAGSSSMLPKPLEASL